jgi:predicted nuclease of predicted toxin-antitoxin system
LPLHELNVFYEKREELPMGKTKKVPFESGSTDAKEAARAWNKLPSVRRKIRAYFDADIPAAVAERTRKNLGWDVLAAQERVELKNQSDEFHYHNARKLGRLFFTLDKDFLNDHRFPLHQSPGAFILIAEQSDPEDIYWAIEGAAIHLVEAFNKVRDFVGKVKVCVSLEGQRIRFVSKESQVVEVVAPWLPKKRKHIED